ncbi:MAG: hypothetical protein K0R08_1018, partial [Solimicrobium sp.]|nr:hypothetical protein [Solimicrobium sp.]
MLPTRQQVNTTRPAFDLSNSNSTERNSTVDSNVFNLEKRIEDNRSFLDGLKRDRGFQNTLTFMDRKGVPEEQLLKFLIGKASLEECLPFEKTVITFLVGSYRRFEIQAGWFGNTDLHFLENSLANTLSTIFKQGYLESSEKTHSKMNTLMQTIGEENNAGKIDLAGIDLSFVEQCFGGKDVIKRACQSGFNAATAEINLISVMNESEDVMLVEREIDRAFSMIENGRLGQAVRICEAVYKIAKENSGWLEKTIIEDKLFEAAIEAYVARHHETSRQMLSIPARAHDRKNGPISFKTYQIAAAPRLLYFLEERHRLSTFEAFMKERELVKLLEKAVPQRVNLKYAAYFLGKVFETGSHGMPKNDAKAKEYLGIAADRGYETRSLRKQREAYTMMLEAQQSDESVFSGVP